MTIPRVRRRPKRCRKPNPGWFQKGPDSRRSSYRPTSEECRRGFEATLECHPRLGIWLFLKLKEYEARKGCRR